MWAGQRSETWAGQTSGHWSLKEKSNYKYLKINIKDGVWLTNNRSTSKY